MRNSSISMRAALKFFLYMALPFRSTSGVPLTAARTLRDLLVITARSTVTAPYITVARNGWIKSSADDVASSAPIEPMVIPLM